MTAPTQTNQDHTHGLILRLPIPDSATIAGRAVRAAGILGEERLSFWDEPLPLGSTDDLAARLRDREVRRPLAGDRLRIVLFGYVDGPADLVLVARRDAIDHRSLRELAHHLTTADGDTDPLASTAVPDPARLPSWWGRPTAPPPWGLAGDTARVPAGPRSGEEVRETPYDPALVVAATALTLSRYEGSSSARLAVVSTPGSGPSGSAVRVLVASTDDSLPVAMFLEQVRADLAVPRRTEEEQPPPVGVVLTEERAGEFYLPSFMSLLPLTTHWRQGPEGLTYDRHTGDPRAVHPEVAAQFGRHVRHLARQLRTSSGDQVLGDLELCPDQDVTRVLALGLSPGRRSGRALAVHEAVAEVAGIQPDAVALSDENQRLTYRELDQRATARAHALRSHGAARGVFVGVCLDRTVDLVVTLLAVLKTGATYVPLDVQHPVERLRFLTEDAGLAVVVTTLPDFPAGAGVAVLTPEALVSADVSERLPTVDPEDPAYVIYTSGTTGRPKGVVVPHRNVLALLDATKTDLSLGPADVWTLFHSAAFDFSVWEIWCCLLTGGHLVVVPYMVTRAPEEFHDLLLRERVTLLSQTPSAFANLLEVDGRSGAALALRLVVLGGEALDPRVLVDWFRRHPHPDCRLVNMYGITETTVHVTAHTVLPGEARSGSRRVGRPIAGWSVSVRDPSGRVLPPGVPGEIYVGGAGLASHYLNQEQLTAERFPQGGPGGERLYRTGDHGRLRLDGGLDHLGRLDDQVKIRGFRIELGEVRTVLLADPAVIEAAVVLDGAEDPAHVRLVGYVVLKAGATTAEVRRRVAGLLPEYMVPGALVDLPYLPLTINGKLDTVRLADLLTAAEPDRTPPAPDDEDGDLARVLQVWRRVLQMEVGPDDDFFALGGNSLLAVRLLTALRDAGLPPISVRDLYVHRTAARLADMAIKAI
ncbi:hypothetical protein Lfu02_79220 [Longispora fulva]|uniref:Amino acid adenylation domain-containing protein n=1 Tax=Longispora fulva TaxID=619741 RepID=A0A8J7GCP8_9ACTN|nr:amino acid adenylation domain-containing protein [Longispora fulva]MBG6134032.1 amino acid adenylation domain-containing protein [Longispora fulva]GIG63550.1 hypothetical protein Lfu02_79220 [Longispora fulva]